MKIERNDKVKGRIAQALIRHKNGAISLDFSGLGLKDSHMSKLIKMVRKEVDINKVIELNLANNKIQHLESAATNASRFRLFSSQNKAYSIKVFSNLKKLTASHNELQSLPDAIGTLQQLRDLRVNNNQLQSLPESMGNLRQLETFCASHNDVASLPNTMSNLRGLRDLKLEANQLQSLPESLVSLQQLQIIDLESNRLTTLPDPPESNVIRLFHARHNQITSLTDRFLSRTSNARLDLRANPLNEETRDRIQNHNVNGGQIVYVHSVPSNNRKKVPLYIKRLAQMYGSGNPKVKEMVAFIEGLNSSSVDILSYKKNASTGLEQQSIVSKTQKEVVIEFLEKVPDLGSANSLTLLNKAVMKHLMNELKNTGSASQEERMNLITSMGTATGDCATPVKSFLLQKAIGVSAQLRAIDPTITKELINNILCREALEKEIIKRFKGALKAEKLEQVELVQGLVNSVFLENAEYSTRNKIKIIGKRPRLSSKTTEIDFAFNRVPEHLKEPFAKLCCQTKNNVLVTKGGMYSIDVQKLQGLTDTYKKELGIYTTNERELDRLVREFSSEYQKELQREKFGSLVAKYSHRKDVLPLLDTRALENTLKEQLEETQSQDRTKIKEQFTTSKIKALNTKLQQLQAKEQTFIQRIAPKPNFFHLQTPQNRIHTGSTSRSEGSIGNTMRGRRPNTQAGRRTSTTRMHR